MTTSLDLSTILPSRYRDKTIDTFIRNLFNRHLSKVDTVPLFGYIGDQLNLRPGEVQIKEAELERQINQLTPFIYVEHATETHTFSWYNLVQKLVTLGVSYSQISSWMKSSSYNFVPPIDLDKFCNYQEYFWIGKWLKKKPNVDYSSLGITNVVNHLSSFNKWSNSSVSPEFYVMKRSTTLNDWSISNLWVHRDDAISFLENGVNSYSDLVQATRPIIEYDAGIGLNMYQNALGVPSDTGTFIGQEKNTKNQLPLFNLYHHDGTHAGVTSSIFYYTEGQEYDVDSVIGRRLVVDDNSDFIFGHSLVNPDDNSLYFYKLNDTYQTIWRKGPVTGSTYSKYDTSGTLINRDKFVNFKNYYWTGVDSSDNPSYNTVGKPEYSMIEKGGSSDWSKYNHWVHVSNLKKSDLDQYVQATRPIIEFNVKLESELLEQKSKLNQLPRFKQYVEDNGVYIQSSAGKNTADGYLEDKIIVRLGDLESVMQSAIKQNTDIMKNSFEFNGETYVQSLYSGGYFDTNGVTQYGYKSRLVDRGMGYPNLVIGETSLNAVPQVLKLTYLGSNSVSVVGTVDKSSNVINTDTPVKVNGVTFTLSSGSYTQGEVFGIEVLSYVYKQFNRFVKINGTYRTFSEPSEAYNESQNVTVISSDPSNGDGIWSVPPQLEWNALNETRTTLKQGDLYYHLLSIIDAQPALEGSSAGINNWRNITPELGLGGTIKQFDGNFALLVSMLLQDGISVHSLLDFMTESYRGLTTSIRSFVESEVPSLLVNGDISLPSGDSIDSNLLGKFKSYFSNYSSVVKNTDSVVDDKISSPFYDSTSSLYNLVVTLPYLGLVAPVKPQKVYDQRLNLNMLQHHDGHRTELASFTIDLAKNIVQQKFKRSSGQESAGIISGFDFPSKPYQGQYWFKTGTAQLFIYNVISDVGELSGTATVGSYSYDRETNNLWKKESTGWVDLGSSNSVTSLPWKEVKLDLIIQNLELAVETELYEQCPPVKVMSTTSYLNSSLYSSMMKTEFERFGVKYGTDVYTSAYDPDNAFTWNYSSSLSYATWQDNYLNIYGTIRPDLEPWVGTQYPTEGSFIEYLVSQGVLPVGTTTFETSMWPLVANSVKNLRRHSGITSKLSVDISTGKLLPPYAVGTSESLLKTPPVSSASRYEFGQNGPVEAYWKSSLDYLNSQQKVFFKINPLSYVVDTWGYDDLVTGEYTFNSMVGRKLTPSDFILHGESLDDLAQPGWCVPILKNAPATTNVYTFKCVSRKDGIFKVSCSNSTIASEVGLTPFKFMNLNGSGLVRTDSLIYTDQYITATIKASLRGFYFGDEFTVTVKSDGSLVVGVNPTSTYQFEGLNQVYVQYGRLYGEDAQISINHSLLNDWTVKLGYRFRGMINTDTLRMTSQDQIVDNSAYNFYVKENKFYNSSWLNALRVQLVKKGSTTLVSGFNIPSTGTSGNPGDDWVFRVDNYNPKRTDISWYDYNLSGESNTFIALNGERTLHSWNRFTEKTGVRTHQTPFLVTGIQNLVNFIFGYSDKLEADGWRFNDQDNPVTDEDTGRALGYQLLVEKFIVQQFSNPIVGSAFVFNPFNRKTWYKTPHGMVAGVFNKLGLEQETVCSVLDQNGRQLTNKQIRVFRQDDVTQLVFDAPVYTLHLLTSEYEHVMLFENYSVDTLLIYDPFLGQRTSRVFLDGEKQANFTGRINYGGHFLLGDQMKKNIENSVSEISRMYDTTSVKSDLTDRARALLGFKNKSYFKDRGTTDATEFRFWQGMIANKGTNFSLDAYINSKSYEDARIDEYWAYKIASYGDARKINKSEMNLRSEDCTGEYTNYFFLESDDSTKNTGYDIQRYAVEEFDAGNQLVSRNENLNGMIFIKPNDESRWKSYSDLNSFLYIPAVVVGEMVIPQTVQVNDLIIVKDAKGKEVNADCFEIWDLDFISGDNSYDMFPYDESAFDSSINQIYYETGEYVSGSSPAQYSEPSFERVNHCTIKILNINLIGKNLKVVAYGPAEKRFSPHQIVDKVNNVVVRDDVIWWDPARGVHHPRAVMSIDLDVKKDPAKYTDSICTYKTRTSKLRPWGAEQVGTVWWNTDELYWAPYSDDRLTRTIHDRLGSWGKVSEMSDINVYEWVVSDTKPESLSKSTSLVGEPAMFNHVKRTRTWWHRPVAWKYSANPELSPRAFSVYQPSRLFITGEKAILNEGSFESLPIDIGTKISGANYEVTTKTDNTLVSIFGMARVTSAPTIAIGSSDEYEKNFDFEITTDVNTLRFRDSYLGTYNLIVSTSDVKMIHVSSGSTQTVSRTDGVSTYQFDQLGITITASSFNGAFWEIVLRSAVSVDVPIDFSTKLLSSQDDASTVGWIAWDDPTSNPCSGTKPPFNQYSPVVGEWEVISGNLSLVADEIKSKMSQDWTWFDDSNVSPYRATWTNWKDLLPTVVSCRYGIESDYSDSDFNAKFMFKDLTAKELKARASVYVNEVRISDSGWNVETVLGSPAVVVSNKSRGDMIRVKINPYVPTEAELSFDPSVSDSDPYVLTQYKVDYPYVTEVLRDENSNKTITNYYYWVKNKTTPGKKGRLSIQKIQELLINNDRIYAIPQYFKYSNQLDGRPNRYGVLSIKNLSQEVRSMDRFMIRLTENCTLRDRDLNITLKPVHEEWMLLRPNSTKRLPKELWDKLIDSLVGTNSLNNTIPYSAYELYDERNHTTVEYGIDEGKVLDKSALAIATVKYTIRNTKIDKYVDGNLVTDYISYDGFDMDSLEDYFSSTENIRKFMTNLWRFAKPAQINEIFFNVLQDAASKNFEMSEFFKTSFISLTDIRTISITG